MIGGREALVIAAAGFLAFGGAGGGLAVRLSGQRELIARRLEQVSRSSRARTDSSSPPPSSDQRAGVATLARVGAALARSGLLPAATLGELRETLANTPLAGGNGLAVFIGVKALLPLVALSFALATVHVAGIRSVLRVVLPAIAALVGLLMPDYVARQSRKRYLVGVEAGLPDMLDMLVICAEAGLGLEPGIERVSLELIHAHPATARELQKTAREMRLITDRRQVLLNLGIRTGLDALRRLSATLIQATQFGTPLTHALRTLAVELRQESMTRYEARAARLPVFLTVPMILFILPCVFIVVGGPAALQVVHVLGNK